MFTRTSSGLQNEHLFYGVDFVVYCEGEEVEGEASSLDEVFWDRVFSENGKSAHCKSMGGKSVLLPLADRVVEEGISHVIVAMDRDYDDVRGHLIDHPQVIYTYGYSWESDVMLDFRFENALSLFVTTNRRNQIRNEFTEFKGKQSQILRRVFALDFKYIGHADKLFDRQKPMSIIATPGTAEPYVKIPTLLAGAKKLGSFQTATLPSADYQTACGIRSFFGKAVARLFFHWFAYRTKRMTGSRKAHYEAFMSLLSGSLEFHDLGLPRNEHYSQAIARI